MRGGKRENAGRKKDLTVIDIHVKIKKEYLKYIIDNTEGKSRNEKLNNFLKKYIIIYEKGVDESKEV